jgi:hypothetical protein
MPSSRVVAASATMSGTGVDEAEYSSVLSPVLVTVAGRPEQSKPSDNVVGASGAVAVKAMTKLCEPPAAIVAGVLTEPVSALVAGSVV